MKSLIAALRSLTLPFGVTTGERIELDGVNGEIRIYDAANRLIIKIDGEFGFEGYGSGGELRIRMLPSSLGHPGAIEWFTGDVNAGGPAIISYDTSGAGTRGRMDITPGDYGNGALALGLFTAPSNDSVPSFIQLAGEAVVNQGSTKRPYVDLTGTGLAALLGAYIVVRELVYGTDNGLGLAPTVLGSYGRGMITGGYAEITANSNTDATGNVFDINGLSITCDYKANRWYLITVNHSGMRSSIAADETIIYITDAANAAVANNGRNRLLVAGSSQLGGSFHYLYTPSTNQNAKVFKVRMDRLTGTGAVGLAGAAAGPSFIMAQDIGGVVP
jgi:hypothetical protein